MHDSMDFVSSNFFCMPMMKFAPCIQGVVHAINAALVPDLEMLRLFCANGTSASLASPVGENFSTMLAISFCNLSIIIS